MAPLVVIVGPTASGKTSLAIELAERFDGEIICADSRSIYKGMDIGTAKPTREERARVPHYGLDLVEPGEPYSAADFKAYALAKIDDIRRRHKVPFLVGGSGLYIDAVVYDYQFGDRPDPELRQKLERLTLDELHTYCIQHNIPLPENQQNKRYVIRAIEQGTINRSRSQEPIDHCIIVGIATEAAVLRERILQRSEQLFQDGMVEEAIMLGNKYGWDSEAMTGNIYKLVHQFVLGEIDESTLRQRFVTADWQLARKQLTWLKRHPATRWLSVDEAKKYISQQLASWR